MLLFSDGFDSYNVDDLRYKWGYLNWTNGWTSTPQIVSGLDTSVFPNQEFATKGGRALNIARTSLQLGTVFKPSRTVHVGFALRARAGLSGYCKVVLKFLSGMQMERGRKSDIGEYYFLNKAHVASTMTLRIYPSYTDITWEFENGITRNHTINTSMNMLSGDYHYIQAAMTLWGNDSAQPNAWIEVRIGNRGTNKYREENILTALPEGQGLTYMNGILIEFGEGFQDEYQAYATIDDFYICNDEGTVNNTFLGNVKVRRALPVAEGSSNDAVPYGATYRHLCVDEDFIDVEHSMPFPIPTPEQDPQFIAWEPGINDYLELQGKGRRQYLRFTAVSYSGSLPKVFGTILHPLAMAKYRGSGALSALKGLKKTGIFPAVEGCPADIPLLGERASPSEDLKMLAWQNYPLVFENDEVVAPGQPYQIWHPEVVNGSEFGFELAPCELDPKMYDPNLLRFSITTYEVVADFLGLIDFPHRFFEEPVTESLVTTDSAPTYQYTWKFTDGLYIDVELVVKKTFPRFINETLRFDDFIPWTYLFAQGVVDFMDEISLQWHDVVNDEFAATDWADGFWEELFTDGIDLADISIISYIELLDEMFGLEEPYLWDGHEDVEENLGINVTYVWDNHELMEEYLYPDDEVMHGIGLSIEDGLGIAENHFDGNWVELFNDYFRISVSILTQHWRYTVAFGMVLDSWQVAPIEQEGMDGWHTGDNPWGA